MDQIITLHTKRLTLRPFDTNDAYIAAYNSRQPSVAYAMSDMVLQDEKAGLEWINWINSISNIDAPWQVLAVERNDDKKCIGIVGVIPQQKINGEVEILFSIADEYQGNGFATEAARALVKWFFTHKINMYLCAIVKLDNEASQRVIEKLGFEFLEEREIEYDYKPAMFKYYRLYGLK